MARDKRDPSRGSQPWVMDRWIKGHDKAGRTKPKWNRPYKGVMLHPEALSLEARGDTLYAYGHDLARRTPDGVVINMIVPTQTVGNVARTLVSRLQLWDLPHHMVGVDGTPLAAGELLREALIKGLNRRWDKMNQWSGCWVINQAAQDLRALCAYHRFGLDLTPLVGTITTLKAAVSVGRMGGWPENACRESMDKIMVAQHALECHLPLEEAA